MKASMPKSAKVFVVINSILIVLLAWLTYRLYLTSSLQLLLKYISVSLIGGLLLSQVVIIGKGRRLWNMLRAILFVVALLSGLFFIVSLADLFSLSGFITCLLSFVMTVYLIGLRGFLNSKDFLGYLTGLSD